MNEPYRQIAKKSGVALGSVGIYIDALHKEGYLIRKNKTSWLLVNREGLVKRWVEFYCAILKPKISMGKFRFISSVNPKEWEKWPTNKFVWGGENAGALLTNYLIPQDFTIYTCLTKMAVMKSLKLVPSIDGNVEVVQQFWSPEIQSTLVNTDTVPPLIVYAELISSLDSRNWETAARIPLNL